MPHSSSQTFLRELFIRSDDTLVVSKARVATGMSPLPNLAGLAPAKASGDAGLIDLIATIPFQQADRNSSRRISTHRNLSRHSATTPDGGTIGDIMVFGQDQWAWGAHLRRAQRARRVRLRRKQPNQSNPTTWRLAAMNMATSLPRQSGTATGGIDFDFGKEPADTFTRDQHPVIEEMIQMAKDMQEAMKRHEELGLNPDEEAFYDALADRPEVLLSMGDATLKKLASELTEKLRNSTTVDCLRASRGGFAMLMSLLAQALDWQFRDSVRAKMRILIRQLLRKYKYPPEGYEDAIGLVLQQAEALADDWTVR